MIDALGVTSCCGAVGGHIERSKVIFQNQLAIGPTILMDGKGHSDISSYFHKWARHYIANALYLKGIYCSGKGDKNYLELSDYYHAV